MRVHRALPKSGLLLLTTHLQAPDPISSTCLTAIPCPISQYNPISSRFTDSAARFPESSSLPGPTEMTLPRVGFSLAVSGR